MKKPNSNSPLPWEEEKHHEITDLQDDAFFRVIRNIVLTIPGISGLFTKTLFGLDELLSEKKKYRRAIYIENNEHILKLTISVIVRAGIKITEIADTLQQKLKTKVQEKTGKEVDAVTVKVERILLN
jgi:uncharacterized alkaline shock family protein YloU